MGCDDESATDEEQAEKILYYYPECESLNDQLNKINMVEGLIDFATKFSVDAISTVVMQQNTWAFYECEKNIWLIAAVDSQTLHANSPDDFTNNHQSNTYALEASLRSLYSMYYTTHGAMQQQLGSGQGDAIQSVKTLRKQIRKLRLRLRQEMQDLQSLVTREKEALEVKEDNGEENETESVPVEHMGIRANTKTILQVQTEIDQSNAEIDSLSDALHSALRSPLYTPVRVRRSVAVFMRFYLASGELDSLTCLVGMKGLRVLQTGYLDPVVTTVNNCTLNNVNTASSNTNTNTSSLGGPYSASVHYHHTLTSSAGSSGVGQSILSGHTTLSGIGSAFSSTVLRIRSVLEQATAHQVIGSIMLYDGRLLWSDLDNQTTLYLTDYVTLQDTQFVRNAAAAMINHPNTVTDIKYTGANGSTTGYFKKSYNSDADLEAAVSKKLLQLLTLRGFVTRQWGTLNLEEAQINPLLLDTKDEPLADGNADVTEEASLKGSGIYCPRIYAQSSDSITNSNNSGTRNGGGGCIGRAVFYRHNRAMIVLLLKDWDSSNDSPLTTTSISTVNLDYKRPAMEHILRDLHTNNRHTRNMYATDFIELVGKYELNDYYGTGMYSNTSNASSVSSNVDVLVSSENGVSVTSTTISTSITTSITTVTATEAVVPSNVVPLSNACIDNACLVGLCCSVQLQTSADLVKLEKAFKNITYSDETGVILKNTLLNGYNDNSSGGGSGISASSSSGNLNSLGGSSAANSISTAVAYERIASAITIAEELQLGYTRPELPLSQALKNTRFVYYNPIDCSLKVCGINSSDLSPLLCSPKHFRDFIISNLAATTTATPTTSSKQYVPLSQQSNNNSNSSSGSSRSRKVCSAVMDKLSDRGGFKFPANSSLLADCLEPPVVRALNDIWIQLAGRELLHSTTLSPSTTTTATSASTISKNPTSASTVCNATAVHEACLRVSTPQRGGVWVTGRNIGGRFLYMVIDKCVTMNDNYHAFEQLSELLVR